MVTTGKPISAVEAQKLGLIDQIVEADLRAEAVAYAAQMGTEEQLIRVRDSEDKLQSARDNPMIFEMARSMIAKRARNFAPEYNIRCIEAAVNEPFEQGQVTEAKLFMELMTGHNLGSAVLFFSERQAGKVSGIDKNTPIQSIQKVGVIGAGTMGGGIAMNMANVGIPVTIIETSQEALDRGLGIVRKNYQNTAKKVASVKMMLSSVTI